MQGAESGLFTPANLFAAAQVFAAIVTAGATIILCYVTWVLAKETRRLAERSSFAHVVATIEPNDTSTMHFDMRLSNVGNGAAYAIEVAFDPPLPERKPGAPTPFRSVSVLKPGREMAGSVGRFDPLRGQKYMVTIKWKRAPNDKEIEVNSYALDMGDFSGLVLLGITNPATDIANTLRKIREDWKQVTTGHRALSVETHTHEDRQRQERELSAQLEEDAKQLQAITERENVETAGEGGEEPSPPDQENK